MPYRIIPRATRQKLENPAPVGQRHTQISDIVCAMTGRGFTPDEIFDRVRPNYIATGPDAVPDDEIWSIIHAAATYDLAPPTADSSSRQSSEAGQVMENVGGESIESRVRRFVGSELYTEDDFGRRSLLRGSRRTEPMIQAAVVVSKLFKEQELVNIVAKCTRRPDGKAAPSGYGRSETPQFWRRSFIVDGVPSCDGGAWIRLNPLDGRGIGNENVTSFRYALIESDILDPQLQLALLAKLPLPIAAVISSGGKSYHAWVKLDSQDAADYEFKVRRLLRTLSLFGVDIANKNPSRLSRLPGAIRKIGAVGSGKQNLIFFSLQPEERQVIAKLPIQEDSDAP